MLTKEHLIKWTAAVEGAHEGDNDYDEPVYAKSDVVELMDQWARPLVDALKEIEGVIDNPYLTTHQTIHDIKQILIRVASYTSTEGDTNKSEL